MHQSGNQGGNPVLSRIGHETISHYKCYKHIGSPRAQPAKHDLKDFNIEKMPKDLIKQQIKMQLTGIQNNFAQLYRDSETNKLQSQMEEKAAEAQKLKNQIRFQAVFANESRNTKIDRELNKNTNQRFYQTQKQFVQPRVLGMVDMTNNDNGNGWLFSKQDQNIKVCSKARKMFQTQVQNKTVGFVDFERQMPRLYLGSYLDIQSKPSDSRFEHLNDMLESKYKRSGTNIFQKQGERSDIVVNSGTSVFYPKNDEYLRPKLSSIKMKTPRTTKINNIQQHSTFYKSTQSIVGQKRTSCSFGRGRNDSINNGQGSTTFDRPRYSNRFDSLMLNKKSTSRVLPNLNEQSGIILRPSSAIQKAQRDYENLGDKMPEEEKQRLQRLELEQDQEQFLNKIEQEMSGTSLENRILKGAFKPNLR